MASASPRQRSLVAQHPALDQRLTGARDDVAAGQRARLLDAMVRVVADKGYAAATVADVVRAAGVSRSTFYELFASKEACFLEAYRHGVDVLIDTVRAAAREHAQAGWRVQLRETIRAYLAALAAEPDYARMHLFELHAAGAAALAAREEAIRRFADRYRRSFERARQEDPSLREPHPDALFVLCAGTEQLLAERLRTGANLLDLDAVFCDCAESVLLRKPEREEQWT